MKELLAFPILVLVAIVQMAVVGRITLLAGSADLMLLVLVAWALQPQVATAWHWAIAGGALVGFASRLPWAIPLGSYLLVVAAARLLQRRVWEGPLLAMFTVTFLGTLLFHLSSLIALRLTGTPLSVGDALGLVILPSVLLNLLLSIPVFFFIRDFARWVYPVEEE
ncbi:MAG: hypothetical protein D6770_00700 [Anaerolineae bacterium]|nr:MAG: hypothetical protein D6770_00700 [Anaerolineae bacterium]